MAWTFLWDRTSVYFQNEMSRQWFKATASGEMSNFLLFKNVNGKFKNLWTLFNTFTLLKSKITSIKKECSAIQSNPQTPTGTPFICTRKWSKIGGIHNELSAEALEIHTLSLHGQTMGTQERGLGTHYPVTLNLFHTCFET